MASGGTRRWRQRELPAAPGRGSTLRRRGRDALLCLELGCLAHAISHARPAPGPRTPSPRALVTPTHADAAPPQWDRLCHDLPRLPFFFATSTTSSTAGATASTPSSRCVNRSHLFLK
jgi:hypothetical protein